MRCSLPGAIILATVSLAAAEVRHIPPPGVGIPEADRAELRADVEVLGREIDALRKELGEKEWLALPDVQIFHKAVDWALRYDEFMDVKDVPKAKALLAVGMERAKALRAGEAPWTAQTGLIVRGYRSNIDGSVQPYGLLIPDDFKLGEKTSRRLDFWCHGRDEKLTELRFIDGAMKSKGEFQPPGAIVCFLYGRFCNANKFAGERDLFEALEDIKRHYNIDLQRLVIRGFSMGGAACWQFATHHSDMWAAAAPGAGFAETAEFFKVFAEGKTPPPWWEQVLWRWYDCTTMAANLANTNVVAYSGEIDGQKQAADIMVKYAKQEGIEFPHIIGPQTAHKYHPESKVKIEELVTAAANKGINHQPKKITMTTYSLKWNEVHWITIDSLEKHWEQARIDAEVLTQDGVNEIVVKTQNLAGFSVNIVPADLVGRGAKLVVDGQDLGYRNMIGSLPPPGSNQPVSWWRASVLKSDGKWAERDPSPSANASLAKRHDLQGPIDDAFMSRFIFVRPTGKPLNEALGVWTKSELDHAVGFWRRVFRGEAPVKDDTAITEDDIANANLILWGDSSSNAVLKKVIDKLPLQWTADVLEFNRVKYDAVHHAPILVFPNPLTPPGSYRKPQRYIVLNSGPTFREEALLNNSDQTPKLPDWAIVNIDTPPDGKWPGQIIDAGFFDEQWALPKK